MSISEEVSEEAISEEIQELPITPPEMEQAKMEQREMEQIELGEKELGQIEPEQIGSEQIDGIGQELGKKAKRFKKPKTKRTKLEPLDPLKFLPEWSPELNKKFIGESRRFKVFTVSGEFVRNNLEADFTMGSHHYMSSFIPEGEVWLDEKMSENDRIALIHHEIHETKLMKKGMSYEEAHASATRSELRLRKKKFNNKHKNLPLTLFCPFSLPNNPPNNARS